MSDRLPDEALSTWYKSHSKEFGELIAAALAARFVGVSRAAVAKAIKSGKMRCFTWKRRGSLLRFVPLSDVEAWQRLRLEHFWGGVVHVNNVMRERAETQRILFPPTS